MYKYYRYYQLRNLFKKDRRIIFDAFTDFLLYYFNLDYSNLKNDLIAFCPYNIRYCIEEFSNFNHTIVLPIDILNSNKKEVEIMFNIILVLLIRKESKSFKEKLLVYLYKFNHSINNIKRNCILQSIIELISGIAYSFNFTLEFYIYNILDNICNSFISYNRK